MTMEGKNDIFANVQGKQYIEETARAESDIQRAKREDRKSQQP